jgi:hypothetical protein
MECGELLRLVEEYQRASFAYAEAARALNGHIRTCPVAKSKQLREAADEARTKSAEALAAITCHRAEHGCLSL